MRCVGSTPAVIGAQLPPSLMPQVYNCPFSLRARVLKYSASIFFHSPDEQY